MRILVTGGAGYIGSHAVKLFLARGHDVWVYDNLVFGHRQAVPAERLVVADLSETARLDQVMVERRIEAVVHFAAFAYVGESVQHPAKYYQNNLVNALNLPGGKPWRLDADWASDVTFTAAGSGPATKVALSFYPGYETA